MRILLYTILFFNSLLLAGNFDNYFIDPFAKKKNINFSLNDISNYPIGIFDLDLNTNVVIIDQSFTSIKIYQDLGTGFRSIPYTNTFENYLNDLLIKNQKYNIANAFKLQYDISKNNDDK